MKDIYDDGEFKIEEVYDAICDVVDSVFTKKELEEHKDYFGDMNIYNIKDNLMMDMGNPVFKVAEEKGYRGKSLKRFIKHGCKNVIDLETWLLHIEENGGA